MTRLTRHRFSQADCRRRAPNDITGALACFTLRSPSYILRPSVGNEGTGVVVGLNGGVDFLAVAFRVAPACDAVRITLKRWPQVPAPG